METAVRYIVNDTSKLSTSRCWPATTPSSRRPSSWAASERSPRLRTSLRRHSSRWSEPREPVASATPPPWHASCSRSSPPGSHTPIPRHGRQRFTCSARSMRRRYGHPCRRQRVQRLPNSWQRSLRSPSARDRRCSRQLAAGARSIRFTSATTGVPGHQRLNDWRTRTGSGCRDHASDEICGSTQ
jgi:hypothetical protein